MLQDLSFGRLENEFCDRQPSERDIVFCFNGSSILIHRDVHNYLMFPCYSQVMSWYHSKLWTPWGECSFRYIFRLQNRNYFLLMGDAGLAEDPNYTYESVRSLRDFLSKDDCFAAMTAWHLFVWYRSNRYCGSCGSRTQHDSVERMLRCPNCGNMIYPKISPAVIVAVTDANRLLLSKYAGRSNTRYALIAGYTEIGETLEQTVQREVMEEVGLCVKNIRYYKSQPWGIDGNVLMGFFCDLDGDDTVTLDRRELALAEWHERNALPAKDDGMTLTREMIRVFEEAREPKI